MSNAESIVTSWLQGDTAAGGKGNPAGSLFTVSNVDLKAVGNTREYGVLNTGPLRCDTIVAQYCFG
ncbi:DUF6229 family protein [Oleiagrimonas soli]|uniref:Uncharacterized protein n=1 Tax=Oleiagrimonas soli TaxID=1543381 RepID=A0A099CX73_9GAMM|nr:DUF6229 family protein [Oleiagrimonas soli]KGI78558.1 hypothetical protein LF63_0103615 [Oleiagrimonas soli]MBB6184163.1 hypothetical protein [Oleiagrimonas soli]